MTEEQSLTNQQAAELIRNQVLHIRILRVLGQIDGRKWGRTWQFSRRPLLDYMTGITAGRAGEGPSP